MECFCEKHDTICARNQQSCASMIHLVFRQCWYVLHHLHEDVCGVAAPIDAVHFELAMLVCLKDPMLPDINVLCSSMVNTPLFNDLHACWWIHMTFDHCIIIKTGMCGSFFNHHHNQMDILEGIGYSNIFSLHHRYCIDFCFHEHQSTGLPLINNTYPVTDFQSICQSPCESV